MSAVLDRPAPLRVPASPREIAGLEAGAKQDLPALPVTHAGTILEVAATLYAARPDWITFFREVLGVNGIIRRLFTTPELLAAYEATEGYAEIQRMLMELRADVPPAEAKEATRVITVRLPASLHLSLLAEAHERHTSMNQLAISKLLQVLEA